MASHTVLGTVLQGSGSLGFTVPLAQGLQSFHIYSFSCGIAPLLAQGFHTTFKTKQALLRLLI